MAMSVIDKVSNAKISGKRLEQVIGPFNSKGLTVHVRRQMCESTASVAD